MLRLRPYKPADAEYLMRWLREERTVGYWKADRFAWPLTREQLENYEHEFTQADDAFAFTALTEDGTPAGHFSFREIDYGQNTAHMGFIVVDPDSRGRGYGRQMVRLALDYAFSLLGMECVWLGVYDCNEPARRCYEAEGFRRSDREGYTVSFHGETWNYFYLEARRFRD